eukprot:1453736-Amphidinium_carterae.1
MEGLPLSRSGMVCTITRWPVEGSSAGAEGAEDLSSGAGSCLTCSFLDLLLHASHSLHNSMTKSWE